VVRKFGEGVEVVKHTNGEVRLLRCITIPALMKNKERNKFMKLWNGNCNNGSHEDTQQVFARDKYINYG
jgi:hypothetical protein